MFFDDCPIALSLDCETLSLDPRAHILQVGYCVVNLISGDRLVPGQNHWIDPNVQGDRVIDVGTVRWWMGQNPQLRARVWSPPEGIPYTAPHELFDEMEHIVKMHGDALRVWTRGYKDLVWLETLWSGRTPWHYRQATDMRAVVSIFDPNGECKPQDTLSKHDGAADAEFQATHLFNVAVKIRRMEHASIGRVQP